MKIGHFEAFRPVCPNCLLQRIGSFPLQLQIRTQEDDVVQEGQLFCSNCNMIYPILLGIPIIVSDPAGFIQQNLTHILWPHQQSFFFQQWIGENAGPTSSFEISRQYISTYGWSHYHDLDETDSDIHISPSNLPKLAQSCSLLSEDEQNKIEDQEMAGDTEIVKVLDIGAAVGRLSVEMLQRYMSSERDALVLGIDMNFSMIALAQKMIEEGLFEYAKRKVGMTYQWRSIDTSFEHSKNIDFWVADALCLPFDNGSIDHSISCNILDCVADPIIHLQELERVQSQRGLISLFCPYDWSGNINTSEKWIGGTQQMGSLQGDTEATLHWLLSSESPIEELRDCTVWKETSNIPWRIRLHNRSQMHYSIHHIDFNSMRKSNR